MFCKKRHRNIILITFFCTDEVEITTWLTFRRLLSRPQTVERVNFPLYFPTKPLLQVAILKFSAVFMILLPWFQEITYF